jgi:hypothetical protein
LRRATVSALVVSASPAVGAVTFNIATPGRHHDAHPDAYPKSLASRTQPATPTGWDLNANKKV